MPFRNCVFSLDFRIRCVVKSCVVELNEGSEVLEIFFLSSYPGVILPFTFTFLCSERNPESKCQGSREKVLIHCLMCFVGEHWSASAAIFTQKCVSFNIIPEVFLIGKYHIKPVDVYNKSCAIPITVCHLIKWKSNLVCPNLTTTVSHIKIPWVCYQAK